MLENIFGEPTAQIQQTINHNPFTVITNQLIDSELLPHAQPFIRIPSVGIFSALEIDKKIKLLTNSIIKAYEFENRTINITQPEIEAIIMYPTTIKVPLNIREHIAIVSLHSQIDPSSKNELINIFDEINTGDSLASFIGNLVLLNKNKKRKIFIIKKLTCLNKESFGFTIDGEKPIHITNLIVSFSQTEGLHGKYLQITSLFKINKKNYLISDYINTDADIAIDTKYIPIVNPYSYTNPLMSQLNNLSPFNYKRIPEYWKIINKLSSQQINNNYLNECANRLVAPVDRDMFHIYIDNPIKLSSEEQPLEKVIEYIENNINPTVSKEKPGAMIKIALIKQLESIEKSITPQALREQKSWLNQTERPRTMTIIKILQRHTKNIEKIKDQIEQLVSTNQLSTKDKTMLLDKINTIEMGIHKAYEIGTTAPAKINISEMLNPVEIGTIKPIRQKTIETISSSHE